MCVCVCNRGLFPLANVSAAVIQLPTTVSNVVFGFVPHLFACRLHLVGCCAGLQHKALMLCPSVRGLKCTSALLAGLLWDRDREKNLAFSILFCRRWASGQGCELLLLLS